MPIRPFRSRGKGVPFKPFRQEANSVSLTVTAMRRHQRFLSRLTRAHDRRRISSESLFGESFT
jgi:hypothetical protein